MGKGRFDALATIVIASVMVTFSFEIVRNPPQFDIGFFWLTRGTLIVAPPSLPVQNKWGGGGAISILSSVVALYFIHSMLKCVLR